MSDEPKQPLRERVAYQAALLGGFATLASVLLVSGNMLTSEAIAERQREDLLSSLGQVMPKKLYDNDILAQPLDLNTDGKKITVYRGTRDKRVSALAWEIIAQGYAGDIRLILGIKPDGEVLGVRVLSHSETPGLGDKIEGGKSNWIFGFNGMSIDNTAESKWQVKKDGGIIDAFSGATITPRGVVKAIHQGLLFFEQNKPALLDTGQPAPETKMVAQSNTVNVPQNTEQSDD